MKPMLTPKNELPMIGIKHVLLLVLIVALAGCAPYALAVKETYEVATDPRSLATQATDTQAEVQIKAALRGLAGERHQRDRRVLPPGSRRARGRCATGLTSGSGGGGASRVRRRA